MLKSLIRKRAEFWESAAQDETAIICRGQVGEKVISKALNMLVALRQKRIRIYKSQLVLLRKQLKIAMQYLFLPKILF